MYFFWGECRYLTNDHNRSRLEELTFLRMYPNQKETEIYTNIKNIPLLSTISTAVSVYKSSVYQISSFMVYK